MINKKGESMRSELCEKFSPTFGTENQCHYYIEQSKKSVCGLCKLPENYRCIAEIADKPLPLSHSSIQDFMTCPRLFYYKQVRGIQVKNAHMGMPLKLGKLWDTVLQWYLGDKTVGIQEVVDDYDIPEHGVESIKALYKAYRDLGIKVEEGGRLQAPVNLYIEDFGHGVWTWGNGSAVRLLVRGFYDRKYDGYFVENKLSSRPDNYLDIYLIQSQCATYFLADPNLEYCIMEVARTPALKITKREEDDIAAFGERVYNDVMARPAYYFMGYNKDTHTYGKKFFRNEFDLTDVRDRYKIIFMNIHEALMCDAFIRNDRSCKNTFPGQSCDYLGICRFNTMSEDVYQVREKLVWVEPVPADPLEQTELVLTKGESR
jgi:hypothetical protein